MHHVFDELCLAWRIEINYIEIIYHGILVVRSNAAVPSGVCNDIQVAVPQGPYLTAQSLCQDFRRCCRLQHLDLLAVSVVNDLVGKIGMV